MLQRGEVVDSRYVIGRCIAKGSMSAVYLAHGYQHAVRWVIKEVAREKGLSRHAYAALKKEIDALKELEHPHLVRIVDALEWKGALLMVMEYVRGRSLEDILAHEGALPERMARELSMQIADALGYLHSRNERLLYRDCKPSNIIIDDEGKATLIDLGCVLPFEEAQSGDYIPFGTKGYAAPEQYGMRGNLCDATDVYALGQTMRAMLSGGEKPLRGRLRASLPMRRIIRRCTMRNPKRRYRNVAEVFYALANCGESRFLLRIECATRILFVLMLAVSGNLSLMILSAVLFFLLRVPEAFLTLTGIARALEIRRRRKSARVNGVFRIGAEMGTKEAFSWQDIEIPLDEPMTDVRIDLDRGMVNMIVMDGFALERDIMVSCRENYIVTC